MLQIPAYQKQPGFFGNPTHGSGWMVQVQPFPADFRFLQAGSEQSTHFVGGLEFGHKSVKYQQM